jgi:cholesterol transport system auxiliary component
MKLHACILLLALPGCALTNKADPTILKYYSLEAPRHREHPSGSPASGAHALQLRLGRVNAASYIRDRIVFRDSKVEVGYFDDLRWTEKPEAYLRDHLSDAFFEDEAVQEIVGGLGPTLDVDLRAFEEVRDARRVARVSISWVLRDDAVVLLRDSFVIDRPMGDSSSKTPAREVAIGLSAALDDAIDRIVKAVVPKLAVTPSATADLGP